MPRDHGEAVKWSRKAAEQGYAKARYTADIHILQRPWRTKGLCPSLLLASLAAAQGMDGAADGRAIIAERMTPDQIVEAKRLAREWFEKHRK